MREALQGALQAPERRRLRARKRTIALALGAVVVAATATVARLEGSRLAHLAATPMADVTHAFEPEVALALPLPSPPTATPELSVLPPPPIESASSPPAGRAPLAPLPPLPFTKSNGLADARPSNGKDTKPDPENIRRGHGRSLATLDTLETVSHKTRR
jgi:hypothetical protein